MSITTEFYQGDSSDIFKVQVFSAGELVTDLTNYAGKFTVMKKLGDSPLIEKSMVVTEDSIRSQILPDESEDLEIGNYIGVAEITNSGLQYRKETHVKIAVRKQGYDPA